MSISDLAVALPLAVLCVLASAFFSATEVALFSLRRVEREQLARSARPRDQWVLRLLQQPRRLIATVLVGNEMVNSTLAVLVFMMTLRYLEPSSPWTGFVIALAVSVAVVVLFGEVVPRVVGSKGPMRWARAATGPLRGFAFVATPLRLIVNAAAELVLLPLGEAARPKPLKDLSEDEFRKLVDAGSAQGQVDARERRLIHKVFEFSDKNVGQIMTPREQMFAVSYDLPAARLTKEIASRGFSRVPVYQKSIDNIRGVLSAKDLVHAGAPAAARPLAELLHPPLFVPRTTPVKRLFVTFKQKKVHMAIVVNEYGKVLGLVTMDDVLAQLFGAMRDERAALQQTQRRGRASRTPVSGVHVPVSRDSVSLPMEPMPARPEETNPTPKVIIDDEVTPLPEDGPNLGLDGDGDKAS